MKHINSGIKQIIDDFTVKANFLIPNRIFGASALLQLSDSNGQTAC